MCVSRKVFFVCVCACFLSVCVFLFLCKREGGCFVCVSVCVSVCDVSDCYPTGSVGVFIINTTLSYEPRGLLS